MHVKNPITLYRGNKPSELQVMPQIGAVFWINLMCWQIVTPQENVNVPHIHPIALYISTALNNLPREKEPQCIFKLMDVIKMFTE